MFLLVSISYAQEKQDFISLRDQTKKLTSEYFNNYMALNFAENAKLMHDSISFQDPTAKFVFAGKKIEGKAAVLNFFTTNYASIQKMTAKNIRSIFSANHGLFSIDFEWIFLAGKNKKEYTIKMPLIVKLSVKDGKVIKHRDFGDYSFFLNQYNK
jgi:hypothetical protein